MGQSELRAKLATLADAVDNGMDPALADTARQALYAAEAAKRDDERFIAPALTVIPQLAEDWNPLAAGKGQLYDPNGWYRWLFVIGAVAEILILGPDYRDPITGLNAKVRKLAPQASGTKTAKARAAWRGGRNLPDGMAVVFALKWRTEMVWLPNCKQEIITKASPNLVNNCPYATAAARGRRLEANGFTVGILRPANMNAECPSKDGWAPKRQAVVNGDGYLLRADQLAELAKYMPNAGHKSDTVCKKDSVTWEELWGATYRGLQRSDLTNVDPPEMVRLDDKAIPYHVMLQGSLKYGTTKYVDRLVHCLRPKTNDRDLDENGQEYRVENDKGKEVWATVPGSGARRMAEILALDFQAGTCPDDDTSQSGWGRINAKKVGWICPDTGVFCTITRGEALAAYEDKLDAKSVFEWDVNGDTPTDADDRFLGTSEEAYREMGLAERNKITRKDWAGYKITRLGGESRPEMHAPRTRIKYDLVQGEDGEPLKNADGEPTGERRHFWGNNKNSRKGGTHKRQHQAQDQATRRLA